MAITSHSHPTHTPVTKVSDRVYVGVRLRTDAQTSRRLYVCMCFANPSHGKAGA